MSELEATSVKTRVYPVIAPLTYTGTATGGFTYHSDEPISPGSVVKIPLGRQSSLGVVTRIDTAKPEFNTKPVEEVLDIKPLPLHLIELATWMEDYYFSSPKAVWQTMLPAGITRKRRIKKGVEGFELPKSDQPLSAEQAEVVRQIRQKDHSTYLIQGVTGSGKTRIYLELAAEELESGKSVVVLIPEIALTPQLIALFEASFPGRVVPYHSGLTESQKHLAWQKALESEEPLVVMGPRSSLFLPLANLGLIVIDECHETTYKQEQNPKYHAVPTAGKLAALTGATLVLGSATPALTEVYLAEVGKIGLIKLPNRISGLPLPQSHIIDLRDKDNLRRSKFIAEPLLKAIEETLANDRQSLLFINRRGSASSQICGDCGHVATCPTCELPLTFHADHMKLICHICNYRATPVAVCPNCKSTNLRFLGSGTKSVEAEISHLFPSARVARLDKDSANHRSLHQIYRDLHGGKIDILVGTQMIAKGLDLPRLDTIGVINADTMLHMPDFTASERTFQLLSQVSGRAGRAEATGRVYIQTYSPDHPAIRDAANHDFWGFAGAELEHRKLLGYPPQRYLLKLSFGHKDQSQAKTEAERLLAEIRQAGVSTLGPAPAFHERAGGLYQWHIIVKSPVRSRLIEIARSVPTKWKTDLDPINLL